MATHPSETIWLHLVNNQGANTLKTVTYILLVALASTTIGIPLAVAQNPTSETTWREVMRIEADAARITWSPDSTRIATTARYSGDTITIWNVADGKSVQILGGQAGRVRDIDWSPNREQLASSHQGNVILVWDTSTGEILKILEVDWNMLDVDWLLWSPDSRYLANGDACRGLWIWNTDTWSVETTFSAESEQVSFMGFFDWHPSEPWLAVDYGYPTSQVRVINVQTKEVILELPTGITAGAIAWDYDGSFIVGSGRLLDCGGGSAVEESQIWRVDTEQVIGSFGQLGSVFLDLHPSRPIVAVSNPHSTYVNEEGSGLIYEVQINIWDIETLTTIAPVDIVTGVLDIAWSPDGKYLAAVHGEGVVSVWESTLAEE